MQDLLDEKIYGIEEPVPVRFSKRLLSFGIEIGIIVGVFILIAIINLISPIQGLNGILIFVSGLFIVGYYLFESFTGLTPGKSILKLLVANLDGTYASTGKLFCRFLVKFSGPISALVLSILFGGDIGIACGFFINVIIVLGCFMALSSRRQTLHDMIVGTAVFNVKDLESKDRRIRKNTRKR